MKRWKDIQSRIAKLTNNQQTAELVMEMLEQEGVLHLGHGDPDIDQIIEAFKRHFKTTTASRNDRYAASRLAKAHGTTSVVAIIKVLAERGDEQYAPAVNNLTQLEQKWVSAMRFVRTQTIVGGEQKIDVEV